MTIRSTIRRSTSRALTALAIASTAGVLLTAAASPSQAGNTAGNTVRDHRSHQPTVRDHRGSSGQDRATVRDHRKPLITFKGPFG
jgi:hypothetical protein